MSTQAAAIALLATVAAVTAAPLARRAASTTVLATATPAGIHPVGVLPSSSRHRRGAGGLSHGGDPELWVGGGKVVPWATTVTDTLLDQCLASCSGTYNHGKSYSCNQQLSCDMACRMRFEQGRSESQCTSACDRTGSSGCSLKVGAATFTMCQRCHKGTTAGSIPQQCKQGCEFVPASPALAPGFQIYGEFAGLTNQWGDDTPKVQANIQWAIDHLEARTGLHFVEYDPEAHSAFVLFGMFHPKYCSAPAPQKTGHTFINLGWCKGTESILHEMLHVLGVSHTQCRSDRDVYVHVADGANGNYNRATEDYSQGLPYDFGSRMHYGLSSVMSLTAAGSKRLAEQSLTASQIGMGDGKGGINPSDVELINRMYFGGDISGTFVIDGYGGNKNDWHYVTIEEQLPPAKCAGNPATYDAGWGSCSTYAVGKSNHNYCAQDTNTAGDVAESVCRECGACVNDNNNDDDKGDGEGASAGRRVFTWGNRAGVKWTLTQRALSPAQFDVGADCPYYATGYTVATAKLDASGEMVAIAGPQGEQYTATPAKACDSVGDICSGTGSCKSGCPCPMCVTTPAPTTTITSGSTTTTTTTTTTTLMPWHPSNCPMYADKHPDTCWGNTAYQVCPVDRSGAYHAVMKHRGNQKAMHDAYVRLTATGVGCTIAKTPEYDHHPKGCVSGHNIKLYNGKTLQECKNICDKTAGCVAFEYGVAYGGGGGYKAAQCQPQSSANKAACPGAYHNLDLYVKQ